MTKTNRDSVEAFIQSALMEPIMSERLLRTSEDIDDIYKTVDLLRALLTRAEQAEAKLADMWDEVIEAAVEVVGQVRDERCAKCGNPRSDHHYRHPFVGTGGPTDIAPAIRAIPNRKDKTNDTEE